MTSTLSVIALVVRSRESSLTVFGDAIYREKVNDESPTFRFKQFVNSRHDYNEAFKEGDLVFFGGKFTVDDNKLMLLVEMACIIEPQLGHNGERLEWDPTKIPSTKPFVNIATSACEALSTANNMNFVKTKSLIYSPFHSVARYVNFEIGYSKESKWLEHLSDKWSEFANFFVAGFLEAIYMNESTYVQIDAKLVDYDTRFRNPTSTNQPSFSPQRSITNAFAQRRNKSTPSNSPITSPITKPIISKLESNTIEVVEDAYEKACDDDSDEDIVRTNQSRVDLTTPITIDDDRRNTHNDKTKKRQLSDLCNETDLLVIEPVNVDVKPKRSYNKRGGRGGRGGRGKK